MLVWMLRKVMADRGIWSGAALARLLKEKAKLRNIGTVDQRSLERSAQADEG